MDPNKGTRKTVFFCFVLTLKKKQRGDPTLTANSLLIETV